MEIRQATRQKTKARIVMTGTAGSGKTMGALLFAYGLTSDWSKIGLVDTEAGSGELYAGSPVPGENITIGNYSYISLKPPFETNSYREAMKAFEDHGTEVIIFDSLSHLWTGEGGILDKQGNIAAKSGNSWTAWRTITPDLNRFIERLLRSQAHIIMTLRAKLEYAQSTDEKTGKKKVEKLGMASIFREGLDFEATAVFDLTQDHTASCSKDRTSLYDGKYFKITPETGKRFLDWTNSGADILPPAKAQMEEAGERFGAPEPSRKEETVVLGIEKITKKKVGLESVFSLYAGEKTFMTNIEAFASFAKTAKENGLKVEIKHHAGVIINLEVLDENIEGKLIEAEKAEAQANHEALQ